MIRTLHRVATTTSTQTRNAFALLLIKVMRATLVFIPGRIQTFSFVVWASIEMKMVHVKELFRDKFLDKCSPTNKLDKET